MNERYGFKRGLVAVVASLALSACASAREHQLRSTQTYGPSAAVDVAVHATNGILRIVNGFPDAEESDDLTALNRLAASVYAQDAAVFQSQPFMGPNDLGGDGFIKTLTFLHEELGKGESYLRPVQVCAIYAFHPEETPDDVHFVMTTEAQVPQYGQVLNTVLVKVRDFSLGDLIIYHEYTSEPAGGQDCTGEQAAMVDAEWRSRVQSAQDAR